MIVRTIKSIMIVNHNERRGMSSDIASRRRRLFFNCLFCPIFFIIIEIAHISPFLA